MHPNGIKEELEFLKQFSPQFACKHSNLPSHLLLRDEKFFYKTTLKPSVSEEKNIGNKVHVCLSVFILILLNLFFFPWIPHELRRHSHNAAKILPLLVS